VHTVWDEQQAAAYATRRSRLPNELECVRLCVSCLCDEGRERRAARNVNRWRDNGSSIRVGRERFRGLGEVVDLPGGKRAYKLAMVSASVAPLREEAPRR